MGLCGVMAGVMAGERRTALGGLCRVPDCCSWRLGGRAKQGHDHQKEQEDEDDGDVEVAALGCLLMATMKAEQRWWERKAAVSPAPCLFT